MFGRRPQCLRQSPVHLLTDAASLESENLAWADLPQVAIYGRPGCSRRRVERIRNGLQIEAPRDTLIDEESFRLGRRAEQTLPSDHREIQRLDAETITKQVTTLVASVPERDCEGAANLLYEARAVLQV